MRKLWEAMNGTSFDVLRNTVTDMMYEGYPLASLLSQIHDELISSTNLTDVDKALICEKIAEVLYDLFFGFYFSLITQILMF